MTYKEALCQAARLEGYDDNTIIEMLRAADFKMPVQDRELAPDEVEPTIQRIRERHRAMRAMSEPDRAQFMRGVEQLTSAHVNRAN